MLRYNDLNGNLTNAMTSTATNTFEWGAAEWSQSHDIIFVPDKKIA